MDQKEWYAKLEEWAFDDARLHRLPLALLPALAEHLANHEAAEHSVRATVAAPWACPSCSHENHAMAIKCYFCDAAAPNA